MWRLWLGAAAICALAACGSGSAPAAAGGGGNGGGDGGGGGGGGTGGGGTGDGGGPKAPPVARPSLSKGGFTYYASAEGMAPDVWDASPDEAGTVYVAAGDTLLVKRRADSDFQIFDAAAAGITRNCDEQGTLACPMVSVGGGAPGVFIVGLKGLGTDGDFDPDWWLDSGGADVLAFDGQKVTRTRHVHVAGPPHQFCIDHSPPPCSIDDATYWKGRRKVRQILRIAVDHRTGIHHGDVWMAGTHGSFNLLVANPDQRGWTDLTVGSTVPGVENRRYVWEHDHPAMTAWAIIGGVKQLAFLAGTTTALALDPTTGDPWAANETRLASKRGAGTRDDGWNAPMWPPWMPDELSSHIDVWPDPRPTDPTTFNAVDPQWMDAVASLAFCDDGTLWIASLLHGLARRAPDGSISYLDLPPDHGNSASAVACDPSDGSVWVGFGWGGFGRWNGGWWTVQQAAPPSFALLSPVRSIQIDRRATPRIVYIAQSASKFGPGGLTVYDGP